MAIINIVQRDSDGELPKYAWPGGYSLFYILADCAALCSDCANRRNGSIASMNDETDKHWRIVAYDINYEDTSLYCEHCNAIIPAAYAD